MEPEITYRRRAKIWRIKETYRKVKLGLLWDIAAGLVEDLVVYAVSCLNKCRTTSLSENVCPRVLFTGIPVDYKKELQLAFEDYIEAHEGMDNMSRACSSACIALYPVGNSSRSWVLWKIETQSRVRQSNVTKFVMSDLVKQAMNSLSRENQELDVRGNAEADVTQQPTLEREREREMIDIVEESAEVPVRNSVETQDVNEPKDQLPEGLTKRMAANDQVQSEEDKNGEESATRTRPG